MYSLQFGAIIRVVHGSSAFMATGEIERTLALWTIADDCARNIGNMGAKGAILFDGPLRAAQTSQNTPYPRQLAMSRR